MIHLICGRICSGKTQLARALSHEHGAVLLSVDELMKTMYPEGAGRRHDRLAERAKAFLHLRAADIARTGVDVVLDWGFWRRKEREAARAFYAGRGLETRWYCANPCEAEWRRRVELRNALMRAGAQGVYEADEGLLDKLERLYQPPAPEEIDLWVEW